MEELQVDPVRFGKHDEEKVKIISCELGCFNLPLSNHPGEG